MTKQELVKKQTDTIAAYLMSDGFKAQLRFALPRSGVTPERMARIALTEIRRNPKLANCSIESLMGAVMECAQLGLEPGSTGFCWIIPYGQEATFQIGYKGLLQLLWRSDQIASVQSEVVYKNDTFRYANGIPVVLEHIPHDGDRGEATHVYAAIETKSGGWISRVMTAAEINEHRKKYSKAGKGSPWDNAWGEMACKTVLKRTIKRAPISAEAQRAIALDDLAESGEGQGLGDLPDSFIEAEVIAGELELEAEEAE